MESILNTIKKMLGIEEEYEHFDQDIIIAINTAFVTLMQLGVGPTSGFSINSKDATWQDFLGDSTDLEMVKTYIFMKTKLMFDPSLTSNINELYKEQIKELEWRLNVQVDGGKR